MQKMFYPVLEARDLPTSWLACGNEEMVAIRRHYNECQKTGQDFVPDIARSFLGNRRVHLRENRLTNGLSYFTIHTEDGSEYFGDAFRYYGVGVERAWQYLFKCAGLDPTQFLKESTFPRFRGPVEDKETVLANDFVLRDVSSFKPKAPYMGYTGTVVVKTYIVGDKKLEIDWHVDKRENMRGSLCFSYTLTDVLDIGDSTMVPEELVNNAEDVLTCISKRGAVSVCAPITFCEGGITIGSPIEEYLNFDFWPHPEYAFQHKYRTLSHGQTDNLTFTFVDGVFKGATSYTSGPNIHPKLTNPHILRIIGKGTDEKGGSVSRGGNPFTPGRYTMRGFVRRLSEDKELEEMYWGKELVVGRETKKLVWEFFGRDMFSTSHDPIETLNTIVEAAVNGLVIDPKNAIK